jgi:uncharacterized protein (DUF2236 family)
VNVTLPRPFTADRVIWQVHRELALLLGAGRALLLQVAHPLVAAGVADHSRFERDPIGRLMRTLDPMYRLVFGSARGAETATAQLRRVHARVRGVLGEAVGAYPAGTLYDAADPALRLWVHATLIDTTLQVHARLVHPLSAEEERRYYADSVELAHRLDVPEAVIPPTPAAFRRYVDEVLEGDTLAVGPTARRLATEIFRPSAAPALRIIGPLVELVSVGLLPARVRAMYGYPWSPSRQRMAGLALGAARWARLVLPPVLRVAPSARAAERYLSLTPTGGLR